MSLTNTNVRHFFRNCLSKKSIASVGNFQHVENEAIRPQQKRTRVIPSQFPQLQTWKSKCFPCRKERYFFKDCPNKRITLMGDFQQMGNNGNRLGQQGMCLF